jgi:hypothetical protein
MIFGLWHKGQTMNIKCYDNGGKTFDRYTAVYLAFPEGRGLYAARGMSENPFHPQGFGQFSAAQPGRHLGKPIKFHELPENCKKLVIQDLA